jgi:hypothetical protein
VVWYEWSKVVWNEWSKFVSFQNRYDLSFQNVYGAKVNTGIITVGQNFGINLIHVPVRTNRPTCLNLVSTGNTFTFITPKIY